MLLLCFGTTERVHLAQSSTADAWKGAFLQGAQYLFIRWSLLSPVYLTFRTFLSERLYLSFRTSLWAEKQNLVAGSMADSRWRRQGKPFPLNERISKSSVMVSALQFPPLSASSTSFTARMWLLAQFWCRKAAAPTFVLWNSVDQHITCFVTVEEKLIIPHAKK